MKFETENGPTIANPTSEDLEKGIKSVDGKKVVLLSWKRVTFIFKPLEMNPMSF
jgi:hypothetical protein